MPKQLRIRMWICAVDLTEHESTDVGYDSYRCASGRATAGHAVDTSATDWPMLAVVDTRNVRIILSDLVKINLVERIPAREESAQVAGAPATPLEPHQQLLWQRWSLLGESNQI